MKLHHIDSRAQNISRSPHGGRGLKQIFMRRQVGVNLSLPARGAWIETTLGAHVISRNLVAPRTGGVD